jgi:hypothetical protein
MCRPQVMIALLPVCSLSLCVPVQLTAQETKPTYRLAYKFRANQFAHYDVTYKARMRIQKGEVVQTSENVTLSRKHFRVVSVERDGSAVLEPVLDRVRMTARFDDNPPRAFDSDDDKQTAENKTNTDDENTDDNEKKKKKKKPTDPAYARIRKAVGQPQARVKVSASGALLRTIPLKGAVVAKPTKGKPQQSFLVVLPDQAIPIGHEWSGSEEPFEVQVAVAVGVRKNVKLKRRFELLSVEGNLATIESKVVMLTPVKDPKALMQLIQQRPRGQIVFDLERGLIVSQKLTVDETVFGSIGPGSKVRAVTSLVETLVPPEVVAAEQAKRKG